MSHVVTLRFNKLIFEWKTPGFPLHRLNTMRDSSSYSPSECSDSYSPSEFSDGSPSETSDSESSQRYKSLKGFPRFLGLPRFLSFPRFLRLPCFFSFPRFLGFLYIKSFSWGWYRRRQCLNNRGVAMTVSKDICYDLFFRRGLGVTIHHDIYTQKALRWLDSTPP